MRVASFNLESLDDVPGLDPPLSERIAVLRPQLLRLEADVLCLQEVNGQRQPGGGRRLSALERLLEGTPYAGFHQASSERAARKGPADKHNLVILSRWAFESSGQLRNDLVAPVAYRPATARPPAEAAEAVTWDRPLLQARIALPSGRPLHLLNLHLRAPLAAPVAGQKAGEFAWKTVAGWAEGFFLASLKRSGQALEARLAIERVFDEDPEALVLVCGDFNADAQEMPLRILCGDPDDTGNAALAGRCLAPLERGLPEARRYSVIHRGRRLMLDHLLASRSLRASVRAVEAHNEALEDEAAVPARSRGPAGSFHAPLLASFDL